MKALVMVAALALAAPTVAVANTNCPHPNNLIVNCGFDVNDFGIWYFGDGTPYYDAGNGASAPGSVCVNAADDGGTWIVHLGYCVNGFTSGDLYTGGFAYRQESLDVAGTSGWCLAKRCLGGQPDARDDAREHNRGARSLRLLRVIRPVRRLYRRRVHGDRSAVAEHDLPGRLRGRHKRRVEHDVSVGVPAHFPRVSGTGRSSDDQHHECAKQTAIRARSTPAGLLMSRSAWRCDLQSTGYAR